MRTRRSTGASRTTTARSKRRVRWAAIGGTAVLGVGAAAAIGANPFPASDQPKDPQVAALEMREKALASEAKRVNALNAERFASYRKQLTERQREIAAVEAATARAQAGSSSYGGYGSGSSGGYSSAPAATYVQSAPVASSSSS